MGSGHTLGTHWAHTGHLDHGQQVPGPRDHWCHECGPQCPSSDEDTASSHGGDLTTSSPLATTDAQQPPATDHNIVMFPRSLPSHTPHTSHLAAGVTTSHWSLLGTVPHHQHHLQGVGVLVITTTVCGDGDHCGPALCSVDTNPILPGGWLVARPATTGQVATNQGPSLSALSVFPLAATGPVVPQCGH